MQSLHKHFTTLALTTLVAISGLACSGGNDPINPGPPELTPPGQTPLDTIGNDSENKGAQLWGSYELYFDFENETVSVDASRSANFAANVAGLLDPADLQVEVKNFDPSEEYTDVTVDITITHPYAVDGLQAYDVRGIFMGNGSSSFSHNSELSYPSLETDQVVLNADGYSRWFNAEEFGTPGIFGYTPAPHTTPDYLPTANVNPFKYFADGLTPTHNSFEYLSETGTDTGIFKAGSSNTREYVLRFPKPEPGFKCGFAIVANWDGKNPEDHPAFAPETPTMWVNAQADIWYNLDAGHTEGELELDLGVITRNGLPSDIILESTALETPYSLLEHGQMAPQFVEEVCVFYELMIELENPDMWADHELWIIAEYQGLDYTNDFGITNGAGTDTLTAYYRVENIVDTPSLIQPPSQPMNPGTGTDDFNSCMVEDNTYGHAGFYYFGENYQLIKAPLDLSSPGEPVMTLEGCWGLTAAETYGQPNELAEFAVNSNGVLVLTTNASGYIYDEMPQEQCVYWFEALNPVPQNIITVDPYAGTLYPIDVIASPNADGSLYCFYQTAYDVPDDYLELGIVITEITYPYSPDSWTHHFNVVPSDDTEDGSIDGAVSGADLRTVSVDFNRTDLGSGFDTKVYFFEMPLSGANLETFVFDSGDIGTTGTYIETLSLDWLNLAAAVDPEVQVWLDKYWFISSKKKNWFRIVYFTPGPPPSAFIEREWDFDEGPPTGTFTGYDGPDADGKVTVKYDDVNGDPQSFVYQLQCGN